MSSDRHLKPDQEPKPWHKRCEHCGKPYRARRECKYGSNACRQAAYRLRQGNMLAVTLRSPRNMNDSDYAKYGSPKPKKFPAGRLRSNRKGGAA